MIKIQIPRNMGEILENHCKWFEDKLSTKENEIYGITKDDIKNLIKADRQTCLVYINRLGEITDEKRNKGLIDYLEYNTWNGKAAEWNAYKYMQLLGVRVCPYCNRNNVDYSDEDGETSIHRSPFDHFFPKNKYPYLSCSLYNLIPCCDRCNSEKGREYREIVYPYEEEFGEDGIFRLQYDNEEIEFGRGDLEKIIANNNKVELNSCGSLKTRIDKSGEIFKLCKKYSNEKIFMRNLVKKIYAYSNAWGNMNSTNAVGMEKEFFHLYFDLPMLNEDGIYPYQKIKEDILKQSGRFEDKPWFK
jgi:hypothetical protein